MSSSCRRPGPTARLFGWLLQRELDPQLLADLQRAGAAAALAEMGTPLPEWDQLDDLAASYFELFIAPQDAYPPVQSLTEGGAYEGDAVRAIRDVASQLGVERDASMARGAPDDHIGSALELWAEIAERAPYAAGEFARAHLVWSLPLLRRTAGREGFYERLMVVVADFIAEITPEVVGASSSGS